MNFLAMPTLKNVRACFLRPISMMPRFSLKFTLARLRTGIERVGSWLRCAAVMTRSAMPMSFFSTAPLLFGFFCAMFFPVFWLRLSLDLAFSNPKVICFVLSACAPRCLVTFVALFLSLVFDLAFPLPSSAMPVLAHRPRFLAALRQRFARCSVT